MDCEIILIGNELLIGKIKDTNGYWMVKKITGLGHRVMRITVIPDDLTVISSTVRDAVKRMPLFIFISGGLGPTYDDMTAEGLAFALERPLREDSRALQMVTAKYEHLYREGRLSSPDLTPSRRKMALIPEGAVPLRNPAGAAPAILVKLKHDRGKTFIIAMPGFPDELKAVFDLHVIPLLRKYEGSYLHAGLIFEGVGESALAPDLIKMRRLYPEIWIKTHPKKGSTEKGYKPPGLNEIHLTVFTDENSDKEFLKNRMMELRDKFMDIIRKHGGNVIEVY